MTNDLTTTRLPGAGLTAADFHQLAEVPPALTWFANIDNPQTWRAYQVARRYGAMKQLEGFRAEWQRMRDIETAQATIAVAEAVSAPPSLAPPLPPDDTLAPETAASKWPTEVGQQAREQNANQRRGRVLAPKYH